jgi:hypothetical protein
MHKILIITKKTERKYLQEILAIKSKKLFALAEEFKDITINSLSVIPVQANNKISENLKQNIIKEIGMEKPFHF